MTPIRIIRFKPPGQDKLLREVAAKLNQFMSGMAPVRRTTLSYFDGLERCIGCGCFHTFLCPQCRELERLARIKADKPLSTVEQRFATKRF